MPDNKRRSAKKLWSVSLKVYGEEMEKPEREKEDLLSQIELKFATVGMTSFWREIYCYTGMHLAEEEVLELERRELHFEEIFASE